MANAKKTSKRAAKKATKKASGAKKAAEQPAAQRDIVDYHDHVLEIEVAGTTERLLVDGAEMECRRDADTGEYYSSEIPYLRFGSAQELGEALIDAMN